MKNNFEIEVRFADGTITDYEVSAKELIHSIYSDDFGAPPTTLTIKGIDEKNNPLSVSFTYSNSACIYVEE